jgi:hypothetical protein
MYDVQFEERHEGVAGGQRFVTTKIQGGPE